MGLGGWLFARMYDRMTAGVEEAGLAAHRERLLVGAGGRVLEVGAGTGANLPFYKEGVLALTFAEPEAPMARLLERRLRDKRMQADIVNAPAESLPFADAQFDTVVSTLVLCTVRDQARALGEIRRVLTPGGQLLFIEHVRSDDARLARWQDRLNPVSRVVANGCNCNRSTLHAIRAAGFTVTDVFHGEMQKAPPFVRPLVVGTARS